MAATPNVLNELGLLHLHRPRFGAPDAVVAAWYREKAVVLGHLRQVADAKVALDHAERLDHASDDGGLSVAA